ncbi:MAG: glycoside hydrolase family 1 protein [Candidatus Eisenbacteria bacterium]|uniref:Glycoside hydrolase family 1 protein n=1 Tax=Eiseniibacteriota bacterium TaxID=2212470 RepID=A0A933SD35_UNCEI|nr:glycoside hydrolase family 1 protein [Candidatus Eisenbacteria bacterium]
MEERAGIHSANFHFPEGFLWGASTSAHQVEGGNTLNDWHDWEQAGRVPEKSGRAADHWNRFRSDFDLARSLGHNAHRFSLEWSRIEPADGVWNPEAIAHYREVLEALRERGIEPVVTLFHYTMPRWMAARGGWESPDMEKRFARYVRKVVSELGPLARWWITLNEPMVQMYKGWLLGQWPPGRSDWGAAVRVLRHMMRAHVIAYHHIHDLRPDAMVSIAKHALAFSPCDPRRWRDRLSVRMRSYVFNHLILDGLHTGMLHVPGLFWERLPAGRTLDFIGVNYYTRDFVHNTGLDLPGWMGGSCGFDHRLQVGKLNDLGWEVYPEGLAKFLHEYSRFKLPIVITENGVPAADDDDRWTFLFMHLWQVARAIADGVPVVGYLHWSLLDNFEWADGYRARFGLIEVDYETMERRIRRSALKYADIIRRNEL